jgi:hypothetical protein
MAPDLRLSRLVYEASQAAAELSLVHLARLLEIVGVAIDDVEFDWLQGKHSPLAAAEAYLRQRRKVQIESLRDLASDPARDPKVRMRLNAAAMRVGDPASDLDHETIIAPSRPVLLRALARIPVFHQPRCELKDVEWGVTCALGILKIRHAHLVFGPANSSWGERLYQAMVAKCIQVSKRDDASPALYVRALLRAWGVAEHDARNWVDGAHIE